MSLGDKKPEVDIDIVASLRKPELSAGSESVAAEHMSLLTALQDFIITLVSSADRDNQNVLDQPFVSLEAGKLLLALEEFVSGIIKGSKSGGRSMIQADLSEDENINKEHTTDEKVFGSPEESTIQENDNHNSLNQVEKSLQTPEDFLLLTLRDTIFNKMPIRLLCFEKQGTSLHISLVERGAIYARIAALSLAECEEQALKTNGDAFQLSERNTQYAILSHTWLSASLGELTYNDWYSGSFDTEGPGYKKLLNFCKVAYSTHEVSYGWVDTVCINKESSSELDESIRSMYNWYQRAKVCLVYLAETETLSDMDLDPWFTRGWTLQELLAPRVVKFYSRNWRQFVMNSENDKENVEITKHIALATTITRLELYSISSISRKMELAAKRKVTREEDTAYSLMGLFDVSFSTAYGEGKTRAFSRLLQAILASSQSPLDLLNWGGSTSSLVTIRSGMLPASPEAYRTRLPGASAILRPVKPLLLTHLGLRIPLLLLPGISIDLHEKPSTYKAVGDYAAVVGMQPLRNYIPNTYGLLDKRIPLLHHADGRIDNKYHQYTFGVYNIFAHFGKILISTDDCRAKCLKCFEAAGSVTSSGEIRSIATTNPIAFKLEKRTEIPYEESGLNDGNYVRDNGKIYYCLEKDELVKHGMQLVTLYL